MKQENFNKSPLIRKDVNSLSEISNSNASKKSIESTSPNESTKLSNAYTNLTRTPSSSDEQYSFSQNTVQNNAEIHLFSHEDVVIEEENSNSVNFSSFNLEKVILFFIQY